MIHFSMIVIYGVTEVCVKCLGGWTGPKMFKRFYSERACEWHYGVHSVIRLKANPLVPTLCWWVSWTPPFRLPHPPPLHTTMFPCIALVMPFSRDTLYRLNMTLVHLSGAKSLRDPVVSRLLGEWVASSPLARPRWSEATEVGYPSLIRDKQKEAVKQYASLLFPAPDLIGLLMDLNVPKLGFRHVSEYTSRRGSAYTAATGLPFPRPIPTWDTFTDTWKELVTPLELLPPVSVPDPPASGRSWPLPSWARYVQTAKMGFWQHLVPQKNNKKQID